MRPLTRVVALAGLWPVAALAAAPADLERLEQAWHLCVREAYAHQPPGQSRAGDERNALDACKAREDAYVAALMAARAQDDDRSLRARAGAWVASFAASVLNPVTAWIEALKR